MDKHRQRGGQPLVEVCGEGSTEHEPVGEVVRRVGGKVEEARDQILARRRRIRSRRRCCRRVMAMAMGLAGVVVGLRGGFGSALLSRWLLARRRAGAPAAQRLAVSCRRFVPVVVPMPVCMRMLDFCVAVVMVAPLCTALRVPARRVVVVVGVGVAMGVVVGVPVAATSCADSLFNQEEDDEAREHSQAGHRVLDAMVVAIVHVLMLMVGVAMVVAVVVMIVLVVIMTVMIMVVMTAMLVAALAVPVAVPAQR